MKKNTALGIKLLLIIYFNTYSMLQQSPIIKSLTIETTYNPKKYPKNNNFIEKMPLNNFFKHYCSIAEKDCHSIYKALEKPDTPKTVLTLLNTGKYSINDITTFYDYNGKQLISCINDLHKSSECITWFKIVTGIHLTNMPIFGLSVKLQMQEFVPLQLLGEIIHQPSAIILMSTWLVLCYQLPFVPFWVVSKQFTKNRLPRIQQNHYLLRSLLLELETKEVTKVQTT